MPLDEETPLLRRDNNYRRLAFQEPSGSGVPTNQLDHQDMYGKNAHLQFCALTGCPPSDEELRDKFPVPKKSLYGRTVAELKSQRIAYNASAILSNTLLLSQVMLGAALTALGASESSHILITLFGALNTVIAGLIAYLKSRGQPMRARMYRDDLERVVDEIENSEVMWRGISEGVHGYNDIDTDEVTVRSEVARLTRLYDRAIRLNGMNNPDMYMAGGLDGNTQGGSQQRGGQSGPRPGLQTNPIPAVTSTAPQPSADNAGPSVPVTENPDDISPAMKADVKDDDDKSDPPKESTDSSTENTKASPDASSSITKVPSKEIKVTSPPPKAKRSISSQSAQPQPQPVPIPPPVTAHADDPDASPATAARLKPKRNKSDKPDDTTAGTRKVAGDEAT